MKKTKHLITLVLGICIVILGVSTRYLGALRPAALAYEYVPKVIIDAGHGGIDGGAVGQGGTIEKDINLAIALKLRDLLVLQGFDVILTREEDSLINDANLVTVRQQKSSDLNNRLKIIEANPDAIFISIHQNKFTQEYCCGTQVFYSQNHEESQLLAETMQQAFINMLQPENTRVHKPSGSEIYLLHKAKVPAIMVECGFLSNIEESKKLADDDYQNQIAFTIYSGLMGYFSNR